MKKRKLLLEICISFLKESWAAGTQRRRRGGERPESLALDPKLNPMDPSSMALWYCLSNDVSFYLYMYHLTVVTLQIGVSETKVAYF